MPLPRAAAIDIGTNSVLLLVAERGPGGPLRAVREEVRITRLGQGVDRTGSLAPEAIARTLASVGDYARILDELGVERRAALGTAALRDAQNGAAFLGPAQRVLGCEVEVISGEREASLVLSAVRSAFGGLPDRTLVLDVGGGSTELILAEADRLLDLTSLQLGSVRLTERHVRHDPPTPDELRAVAADVARSLATLPATFSSPPARLIGVAGTVTTLATVELGLARYDADRVNGCVLSREQVAGVIDRLAALPLVERRGVIGLEPARADVIVAGALIVKTVAEHFGLSAVTVSDRGVRWGRAAELLPPEI
ncbi:MAG: Ppx/GppA family phosphatase [Deltaproteobacteria bacterium]|nr:Ppx/GppA family phosphatase [Deltaproteobacteria bacterium]